MTRLIGLVGAVAIMGVALFTPDGKSLVTAGDDGVIRIWEVPRLAAMVPESPFGPFHGNLNAAQCQSCQPSGK